MASLSLADLEAFDRGARSGGKERRFCCPLCHGARTFAPDHRSLAVNVQTGAWNCHRCHESGLLLEFRTVRPDAPVGRVKRRLTSLSDVAASRNQRAYSPPPKPPADPPYDFPAIAASTKPLEGTPAAKYLEGRSIQAGEAKGARFLPDLWGRVCVAFALRGPDGALAGLSVRSIAGEAWKRTLKADHSDGAPSGVFATPGAWESPMPVLVEAPIDALTLALCGVPAIAAIGTSLPDWAAVKVALRPVALAQDNDEGGDRAAIAAAAKLRSVGAQPARLRPPSPFKDWNDALQSLGRDELRAMLAPFSTEKPTAAPEPAPAAMPDSRPPEGHSAVSAPSPALEPQPANADAQGLSPEGLPIYDPSMGEVSYDPPQTVVVAGRPRQGVAFANPRVAEAWAAADRIEESKTGMPPLWVAR